MRCVVFFYHSFHISILSIAPISTLAQLVVTCFQLSASNATHVRLQETTLQYTGRYMCEISTEAPTFSSIQGKGEVHIVGESKVFGSNLHTDTLLARDEFSC